MERSWSSTLLKYCIRLMESSYILESLPSESLVCEISLRFGISICASTLPNLMSVLEIPTCRVFWLNTGLSIGILTTVTPAGTFTWPFRFTNAPCLYIVTVCMSDCTDRVSANAP